MQDLSEHDKCQEIIGSPANYLIVCVEFENSFAPQALEIIWRWIYENGVPSWTSASIKNATVSRTCSGVVVKFRRRKKWKQYEQNDETA